MTSKLLSTKEAIENRRSIRDFKPDDISDEIIMQLLESARLAPSGCNAQPWRFKIVRDLFGWNENLYPVALLPIGYPLEDPPPRKRRPIEDLII
jgi:Nitroreductase